MEFSRFPKFIYLGANLDAIICCYATSVKLFITDDASRGATADELKAIAAAMMAEKQAVLSHMQLLVLDYENAVLATLEAGQSVQISITAVHFCFVYC